MQKKKEKRKKSMWMVDMNALQPKSKIINTELRDEHSKRINKKIR